MTRNPLMRKFGEIPVMMYNYRFLIALSFAAILLLCSCKKKAEDISQKTLQEYFEETILNKNFIVEYAKDTVDITGNYGTDTFVMKKGATYYDGVMTGKNGAVTYTGTWSSNEDYSKLNINIDAPTPPSTYIFLNRAWRFTKKSLPVMELAPWGTTDPKVLHMRRL
jgi:hypothetical protein